MTDEQETSSADARSRSNDGLGAEEVIVADFYNKLFLAQQSLPPEFAKILYDNLWDLYES